MSFRRSGRTQANQPVYSTNQAQARVATNNANQQQQQQQPQALGSPQNQKQCQTQQQQQTVQQQQQQQAQAQQQQQVQQQQQATPNVQAQQQAAVKEEGGAVKKALNQMEVDENGKKKWRRNGVNFAAKLSPALRRKKMNDKLSKILTPKNALTLLHDFKPGCVYKVDTQPGSEPPVYVVHVEYNGTLLATASAMSKVQAKNIAAENAIKALVSQAMKQKVQQQQQLQLQQSDNPDANVADAAAAAAAAAGNNLFSQDVEMKDSDATKDPTGDLPWAGLASFAIYKMFTEWQNQGTDVPIQIPSAQAAAKKAHQARTKTPTIKTELPANALDLHPTVLLNMMRPGTVAFEVSRVQGPNGSVTMGFDIDGQKFTGTGSNKKEARREAAKAVITSLFGLQYPPTSATN